MDECVESVLGQSFPFMEVLLVDDGSSDGSGELCDAWAARDARVRVIHQANAGAIRAREAGVKAAVGEWVTFVDADDTLPEDALERLLDASGGVDIVVGFEHRQCRRVFEAEWKAEKYALEMFRGTFSTSCAKLYRRRTLTADMFDMPRSLTMGEDWLMGVRLAKANRGKVNITPRMVYTYRQHCGSVMHTTAKSAAYEAMSYGLFRQEVTNDEQLSALIDNKMEFLGHQICRCGMNPQKGWICSSFYKMLEDDMARVGYRLPWLERALFMYRMPYTLRKLMTMFWKVRNKIR